jgi:RNA polymerase sigma factor (sigma-70 family)
MGSMRQVVLEAQAGDGAAFEELVRRFQDMAVGYAARILNDFQLAEDAAQDAFLEAFRVLPQLRTPAAFPTWFRQVVYKQCDRYRRRKSFCPTACKELESIPSKMLTPDQSMESRERRTMVQEAIGELPELEREAILLFYFGDHAQREIADFLGVPLTTLKKRLYKGRQRMKERMLHMVEQDLNGRRPSRSGAFSGRVRHLSGPDRWQPGWRKERSADCASANVYNAEGVLVEVERYAPTGESCGKEPLINVQIETPEGELIVQHVAHRISDDAYDIHVTDAAANLRVILHHSDVSRGEPFTITEEWMDR